MLKSGWTRSVFAIRYLGKPDEARRAVVEDASLRHKVIAELYVWIKYSVPGMARAQTNDRRVDPTLQLAFGRRL